MVVRSSLNSRQCKMPKRSYRLLTEQIPEGHFLSLNLKKKMYSRTLSHTGRIIRVRVKVINILFERLAKYLVVYQ